MIASLQQWKSQAKAYMKQNWKYHRLVVTMMPQNQASFAQEENKKWKLLKCQHHEEICLCLLFFPQWPDGGFICHTTSQVRSLSKESMKAHSDSLIAQNQLALGKHFHRFSWCVRSIVVRNGSAPYMHSNLTWNFSHEYFWDNAKNGCNQNLTGQSSNVKGIFFLDKTSRENVAMTQICFHIDRLMRKREVRGSYCIQCLF